MADSERFHVEPSMFMRLEDKKRSRPVNMLNAPPTPDQDRNYVFFDSEDDEDAGSNAGDLDVEAKNVEDREAAVEGAEEENAENA